MVEYIKSLFDNANEKFANPFLGTLIFVWLARNFYLVYALLNFDEGASLDYKTEYICMYFEGKNLGKEVFINILFALVILVLTYIFKAITEAIQNYYHDIVSKRIKAWTIGKSTFTKADFHLMNTKLTEASDSLDKEKEKMLRSDGIIKGYKDKLLEAQGNGLIAEGSRIEIQKLYDELKLEDDKLILRFTELEKKYETLVKANEDRFDVNMGNVLAQLDDEIPQGFNGLIEGESIPNYILDEEEILLRYFKFKREKDFNTLNTVQKEGYNKIYQEGQLLEFLYYVDYILKESNTEIYIDINMLKPYSEYEFIKFNGHIKNNELRAKHLEPTTAGLKIFNYLLGHPELKS